MTLATNLRSRAQTMLSNYGRSATISRTAEGAYDPTDGTVASGSSSSYAADVFLTNYKAFEVDGQLVKQQDIKAIIEFVSGSEPLIGDTVSVDSVTYRIVDVQKIVAQSTVIVYKAQLRI